MNIPNGTWVSCYATPDAVVGCLPKPDAVRIVGQVIGCQDAPPSQPGAIPDCRLTIRGRTGRTLTFSFVSHYARVHGSQAEAVASLSPNENVSTPARSSPPPRDKDSSRVAGRHPAARLR